MANIFNKYFIDSIKQLRKYKGIEDGLDYMTCTDSTIKVFQKIEEDSLKSIVRKLIYPNKGRKKELQ